VAQVVKRAFRVRLFECAPELYTRERISTLYRDVLEAEVEFVKEAQELIVGAHCTSGYYRRGLNITSVKSVLSGLTVFEITREDIEIVVWE